MTSKIQVSEIKDPQGLVSIRPEYLVRRLVQRVTRWFFGGLWNPGNNYHEIPGSQISVTPMYDNSILVYTYMCPLGHRGAAHSITHWIFMANGQEYARHNRSVDHQESGAILRWEVPSWGAGRTGTMGYFTRQYTDSNHSVHFNGRRYIDGIDSSRSVPSHVTVEEYHRAYELPVATVTPAPSTVSEGSTVTINIALNRPLSGIFYWTIESSVGNVNSADFTDGQMAGTVNLTNGTGAFTRTLVNDLLTEGTEQFTVIVRKDNTSGAELGRATVTISDTSLNPVATVTPNNTLISEGDTVVFTVSLNPALTGTYFWTTNQVSGTINGSDFSGGATSGSFTVTNGAGSISRTLLQDAVVEGTEAFTISVRRDSTSGAILGTSAVVSVSDRQVEFTTPGTFSWIAPSNVTSVSAVCVGGGGGPAANTSGATGAGGGGLGWRNNIAVTPGQSYTVQVGAGGNRVTSGTAPAGGASWFINTSTVVGFGGGGGQAAGNTVGLGGSFVGAGGGNGGNGGNRNASTAQAGGGGGAGGYSGNGGNGGNGTTNNSTAGQGGGGGGGGGGGSADSGGAGGGVGIYGQGANGAAGASTTADGRGGFGGSGGGNATNASTSTTAQNIYSTGNLSIPGQFGGGACGADNTTAEQAPGASGAVRIIWGAGRAFPSTNTGNI
jgi:hypothetical protein